MSVDEYYNQSNIDHRQIEKIAYLMKQQELDYLREQKQAEINYLQQQQVYYWQQQRELDFWVKQQLVKSYCNVCHKQLTNGFSYRRHLTSKQHLKSLGEQ